MDYASLKNQASIIEDGILLIREDKEVWINLVVNDNQVSLFDYHTGKLVETFTLKYDFDHEKLMDASLDLSLRRDDDSGSTVHLRTIDQAQRLRIGMQLATDHGAILHNLDQRPFSMVSTDRYEDPATSHYDDTENRRDSKSSMSSFDAKQIIPAGTVRGRRAEIANVLVGIPKPASRLSTSRPSYIPPDPPGTPQIRIREVEPIHQEEYDDLTAPEIVPVQQDPNPDLQPNEEPAPDYIAALELPRQWLMSGHPSRREAEEVISGHNDGTFIVRNRQSDDSAKFPYALTLVHQGKPLHIQIERTRDGGLVLAPSKIGEKAYKTLDELIEHYQDNKFWFEVNGKSFITSLRHYE